MKTALLVCVLVAVSGAARAATLAGVVRDDSGAALPGVTVALRPLAGPPRESTTDAGGRYTFDWLAGGRYEVSFALINFATVRRSVDVVDRPLELDVVLHFAVNAEVTVTGARTFANLADVENPAENLVGIAQSASQGAITAQAARRAAADARGEVLETVPGVIVTQHSGEGKANQYFLRGFNLDHGPTWRRRSPGCRSTCRRTRTARAIRI